MTGIHLARCFDAEFVVLDGGRAVYVGNDQAAALDACYAEGNEAARTTLAAGPTKGRSNPPAGDTMSADDLRHAIINERDLAEAALDETAEQLRCARAEVQRLEANATAREGVLRRREDALREAERERDAERAATVWIVIDPEDGCREVADEAEALAELDAILDHMRDRAADGELDTDAPTAAAYRCARIAHVAIETTPAEDLDPDDAEWLRGRGWDYRIDLSIVEDASALAQRDEARIALARVADLVLERDPDADDPMSPVPPRLDDVLRGMFARLERERDAARDLLRRADLIISGLLSVGQVAALELRRVSEP